MKKKWRFAALFCLIILLFSLTGCKKQDPDYEKLCNIIGKVGSAIFGESAAPAYAHNESYTLRVSASSDEVEAAVAEYGEDKPIDLSALRSYCEMYYKITYGFVELVGQNNDLSLYRYKAQMDFDGFIVDINSIELLARGDNSVTIHAAMGTSEMTIEYRYSGDSDFGFFACGKAGTDKAVFGYGLTAGQPWYTHIEISNANPANSFIALSIGTRFIDFEAFSATHPDKLTVLLSSMSGRIDEYHAEYFGLLSSNKELRDKYRASDGKNKSLVIGITGGSGISKQDFDNYKFNINLNASVWQYDFISGGLRYYTYVPESNIRLYAVADGMYIGYPVNGTTGRRDYINNFISLDETVYEITVIKDEAAALFFGTEAFANFDFANKSIYIIKREKAGGLTAYDFYYFEFLDHGGFCAYIEDVSELHLIDFPGLKDHIAEAFATGFSLIYSQA